MLKLFYKELNRIDKEINNTPPEEIPELFKNIPIDIFGMLLLNVNGKIPDLSTISLEVLSNAKPLGYLNIHPWKNIAKFLPEMPPDKDQLQWNGAYGIRLIQQSLAAVKTIKNKYEKITGNSLLNSNVLDFGCGWGRLIRLFYKYTPYNKIYGVDPWDKSLERCLTYNLKCNFAQTNWVTDNLHFNNTEFDLVYAFSVFTHLSLESTNAALSEIRKRISNNGILAITIRPEEYWRLHKEHHDKNIDLHGILSEFRTMGFAFVPHPEKVKQGSFNYGDTSISLDYINVNWKEWKIVDIDFNIVDPLQLFVFLKPV